MPRYEGEYRADENTAAHVRGRLLEDYPEIFYQPVADGGESGSAGSELTQAGHDLLGIDRERLINLEQMLRGIKKEDIPQLLQEMNANPLKDKAEQSS